MTDATHRQIQLYKGDYHPHNLFPGHPQDSVKWLQGYYQICQLLLNLKQRGVETIFSPRHKRFILQCPIPIALILNWPGKVFGWDCAVLLLAMRTI